MAFRINCMTLPHAKNEHYCTQKAAWRVLSILPVKPSLFALSLMEDRQALQAETKEPYSASLINDELAQ